MFISIHAPTNGATNPLLCVIHSICFISIHAPTNGATNCNVCFGKHICISIHAPTNGATSEIHTFHKLLQIFQSTLRRTERQRLRKSVDSKSQFQSTLRRTERPLQNAHSKAMLYFNPRSDERSDLVQQALNILRSISIHAPTNGATAILHKKMKKTIQNRLIILLFSTNSLRLLCSCTQYSFFLFIFHGANDLVILCSLSFRTTSKN